MPSVGGGGGGSLKELNARKFMVQGKPRQTQNDLADGRDSVRTQNLLSTSFENRTCRSLVGPDLPRKEVDFKEYLKKFDNDFLGEI